MIGRIRNTLSDALDGIPHWADPDTGDWIVTPDGDWTGGAWVGQLWLAHRLSGDDRFHNAANRALQLLRKRVQKRTAFKSFTFYYGGALGALLNNDEFGRELALGAADSLVRQFSDRLSLIPLGPDAEEANAVGDEESSIDSLQATSLLLWAANYGQRYRHKDVAIRHAYTVLSNHVHADGSVIQSTTLNGNTGDVIREHTHKGYSDTSTWARAQAWAMLYSAHCAIHVPEKSVWLDYAILTADWWIDNVPNDNVAFWDFDDPNIPKAARDTAATAIAAAALLKLSYALAGHSGSQLYEARGRATVRSLVDAYLTPINDGDRRPHGILTGGCFTQRSGARIQDRAVNVELVFGSYYLLESLAFLSGFLDTRTL